MKSKEIDRLSAENLFNLIGKEWMLITAGSIDNFNTMTASWGGLGWLWNRPVAFIFVRPERYTHEFIESNEQITLSFLGKENQDIHNICGKKSGRSCNKIKESGLKPIKTADGNVTFEQARLTLEGKKLFCSPMTEDMFIDKDILARWYNDQPGGGLHHIYVMEIEHVYEK